MKNAGIKIVRNMIIVFILLKNLGDITITILFTE